MTLVISQMCCCTSLDSFVGMMSWTHSLRLLWAEADLPPQGTSEAQMSFPSNHTSHFLKKGDCGKNIMALSSCEWRILPLCVASWVMRQLSSCQTLTIKPYRNQKSFTAPRELCVMRSLLVERIGRFTRAHKGCMNSGVVVFKWACIPHRLSLGLWTHSLYNQRSYRCQYKLNRVHYKLVYVAIKNNTQYIHLCAHVWKLTTHSEKVLAPLEVGIDNIF